MDETAKRSKRQARWRARQAASNTDRDNAMPAKTKTPSKIKCPWCGRVIGFSKSGNIEPHVGPGGVKCVGVGQPRDQVLAQMQLHEECLAEKRRRSR